MTLRLSDFVCVSHQIQNLMLSLHREEDRRNRDGLYRKARSCRYSGAASIFTHLCIAWIGLDILAESRSAGQPIRQQCTSMMCLWHTVDVLCNIPAFLSRWMPVSRACTSRGTDWPWRAVTSWAKRWPPTPTSWSWTCPPTGSTGSRVAACWRVSELIPHSGVSG